MYIYISIRTIVCVFICFSNCVHTIFCLPLQCHLHSQVLRGSAWQCKPDLGPSVSRGMNNSLCSGWCGLQMADILEQTAGLPLMSLSRLSQIVVVLNHLFPRPQSAQAHSLLVANRLISVTAQCHLLIKTKTQLHQCKHAVLHLSVYYRYMDAAEETKLPLLQSIYVLNNAITWIMLLC